MLKSNRSATRWSCIPIFQQPELFRFVVENGIVPIGYSPLGSPGRPLRDRADGDTVDLEDPVIVEIARRLDVHPAVICIQWAIQRGEVVIPMSTNPRNYLANLKAAASRPLTSADMEAIAALCPSFCRGRLAAEPFAAGRLKKSDIRR